MVATNSMGTRSSLELMLDKLQQLDDEPNDDIPPALPARPVSRARLPRARRPLQLEESDTNNFGHFGKTRLLGENSYIIPEKGISNIQKCYRGYKTRCYYNDLRRGVVSLQSFIRGENARRGYNKHMKDWTLVSYRVLVDLRKRVLSTEAKARETKDENVGLEMRIQEMEGKWERYEEKMKCLERKWQDELTNIQGCLAAIDKSRACEIRFGQSCSSPRHYQISTSNPCYCQVNQRDLVHVEDIKHHHQNHNEVEHDCIILNPRDERRELKLKFKAWVKDYKHKLRDMQSTFKKIGNNSENAKCQKNWWGKISY